MTTPRDPSTTPTDCPPLEQGVVRFVQGLRYEDIASVPEAAPLRRFLLAPVLLSDSSDAVLNDGDFTLQDGCALAQAVQAGGKKLTTIYVSQSDPNYYFGLGPCAPRSPTQA
jgi:hypothetical protein